MPDACIRLRQGGSDLHTNSASSRASAKRPGQNLSGDKWGWEGKGPPEIIQKFRLRNWPISSANFPMTPMEGTQHHFGQF